MLFRIITPFMLECQEKQVEIISQDPKNKQDELNRNKNIQTYYSR